MGAAEPQNVQAANGAASEADIVRRPAKGLAACLACDICCGLLVEPLTSPQCMHCFCRECIAGFIVPGQVQQQHHSVISLPNRLGMALPMLCLAAPPMADLGC